MVIMFIRVMAMRMMAVQVIVAVVRQIEEDS